MQYLRKKELFKDTIYSDLGKPATGYGSQTKEHIAEVRALMAKGGRLTKERAEDFFETDLSTVLDLIQKQVKPKMLEKMNQGQLDALIDIFYNVRAKSRVGTVKLINADRLEDARDNIKLIVKGRENLKNGKLGPFKTLKSLQERADERIGMWDGGRYPTGDSAPEGYVSKFEADAPEEVPLTKENDGVPDLLRRPEANTENVDDGVPDLLRRPEEPTKEVNPEVKDSPEDITLGQADERTKSQYEDEDEQSYIDEAVGSLGNESKAIEEEEKLYEDEDEQQYIDEAVGSLGPSAEEAPISQATKRSSSLKDAEAVSNLEGLTPDLVSESNKIAKEKSISKEDAAALVQSRQYRADKEAEVLDEIADINPVLAAWGADAHNFTALAQDIKGFKDLDEANTPFNDDFDRVFWGGHKADTKGSRSHIGLLMGIMDQEEAFKGLDEAKELKKKAQPINFNDDIAEVAKSMKDSFEELMDTGRSLRKYSQVNVRDGEEFIRRRAALSVESGEFFESTMDLIGTMMENKQGTALFVAQSGRQLITTMGLGLASAGVGATIAVGTAAVGGLLLPLPGGTALSAGLVTAALGGAKTGFTPGYVLGEAITTYNAKIEEIIGEDFKGDHRAFYANPEARKEGQKKAVKYSGLMAVLGGLNLKLAGKGTSKVINKSTTLTQAAKNATSKAGLAKLGGAFAKDVIADTARDSGREFISRYTGITGVVEGDTFRSSAQNAWEEAVIGVPSSVITTGVGTVLKLQLSIVKKEKQLGALYGEYVKAKTVIAKAQTYDEMRAKAQEVKADPEKVKSFIKAKEKPVKTEVEKNLDEDLEYESEQDIEDGSEELVRNEKQLAEEYKKEMEEAPSESTAFVDIEQWEAHHIEQSEDPIDRIEELGPEWVAAYEDAKENGTDLQVPSDLYMSTYGDDPSLGGTVRFNSIDAYTPVEALEVIKTLEEILPDVLNNKFEFDSIGDGTGDGDAKTDTEPKAEPKEGEATKKIELELKRTEDEIRQYKEIKSGMTKIIKPIEGLDNDLIPMFAEIEMTRVQYRSRAMLIPIDELISRKRFESWERMSSRVKGKDFNVSGRLSFESPLQMVVQISRLKGGSGDVATIIHELTHSWLYEMTTDWNYLSNQDESKFNTEQKLYFQAMKDMAELIGFEDLSAFERAGSLSEGGLDAFRKAHETIAMTGEKYFLEGKFKNSKIRALMERFRSYLSPLAKIIGIAYNQFGIFAKPIDADIERMFEGILGTSNAIEDIFTPMFNEGYGQFDESIFGEKEAAEYTKLKQETNEQAVGEFVDKMYNRVYKVQERFIKKHKKKFEVEVDKFMEGMKSVNMVKSLRGAEEGQKISTEDFIKVYGEEAYKNAPKGILSGKKRKGILVGAAAVINGYGDQSKFLEDVMEGGHTKNLKERLVADAIKKGMPILKTEDEMIAEAIEIINNDSGSRAKILRLEEKALRKKVTKGATVKLILSPEVQRRSARENVKVEARSIVLRTVYRGMKPVAFLRTASKHSRLSAKYFRSSDLMKALEHKQLQILHNESYKFALKYDAAIRKARVDEKLILKTKIKKAAKGYDWRGLNVMQRTAVAFKNGEELQRVSAEDFKQESMVFDGVWIKDTNEIIDEVNSELQSQIVRENAQISTYLTYVNLLKSIKGRARAEKMVQIAGAKLDLQGQAETTINGIAFRPETDKNGKLVPQEIKDGKLVPRKLIPRKPAPRKKDGLSGLERMAQDQPDDFTRLSQTLSAMYPTSIDYAKSPIGKLMADIKNGEADFVKNQEDFQEDLFKLLVASNKETRKDRSPIINALAPIAGRVPFASDIATSMIGVDESHAVPSLGVMITKAEAMVLLLNSGSQSNLEHLTVGGFKGLGNIAELAAKIRQENGEVINADNAEVLDNEELKQSEEDGADIPPMPEIPDTINTADIEAVIQQLIEDGVITEADIEAAQFVWDSHKRMYEGANDSFEHLNSYRYGRIEAKSFKSKYSGKGEHSGGYFPIFGTDKHVDENAIAEQLTNAFASPDFRKMFPHSDVAYTRKRGGFKDVSLQMALIPYSIHRVGQMKHLAVPLFEFGKLTGDKGVHAALESRQQGVTNLISKWIKSTMIQKHSNTPSVKTTEQFAKATMGRVQTATFYGNIFSAAKQPLGVFQGAVETGVYDVMKESALAVASPKKTREFIRGKSKVMTNRMDLGIKLAIQHHHDMDLNGDYINISAKRLRASTFYMMQATQNQTDIGIWKAAYNQALLETNDDAVAVFHADTVVEKTQGSSSVTEKSTFDLSGAVHKIVFGMYATVPMAKYNLLQESKRRNVDEKAMVRYAAHTRVVMLSAVAASLAVSLAGMGWMKLSGKEEDDEKIIIRMLVDLARELGDFISPAFAHLAIQFAAGLAGIGANDGVRASPAGSFVASTAKKLFSVPMGPLLRGEDITLSAREWSGLANAATLATGIPFSFPGKIYEGLDVRQSEDKKREQKFERSAQRREARSKE